MNTKPFFVNGKPYSLNNFLSQDIKIVVPDLQRDYCWGDKPSLVKTFVKSLLDLFKKSSEDTINLGLVYGYEVPVNHIQLCDGQQRITTLYLLIGMLYRRTKSLELRNCLISEKDNAVRLQYAIRESTLYFLEDLINHFFLDDSIASVESIKNAPWYFREYDLDASIQSMIKTLGMLEKQIASVNDADSFSVFLLSKPTFLYIDLENRSNGEETFVVINTTGEPLSPTEHLKPMLIEKKGKENPLKYSEIWEEWEQYFWKNRGDNDTADNGLKEFFRWIVLLSFDRSHKTKEEFDSIIKPDVNKDDEKELYSILLDDRGLSFTDINTYFEVVKYVFSNKELFKDNAKLLSPDEGGIKQIDLFKLLPVLAYRKKFPESSERDVQRVKHFFSNVAKLDEISKSPADFLLDALNIIKLLPDGDIASLRNISDISEKILTDEEKHKFELYTDSAYNRKELENRFWEEESKPIWNGEILSLINWSSKSGEFDIDTYDKYAQTFNALFFNNNDFNKPNEDLDLTRRVLLTRGLEDYPKVISGYTNFSFGWDFSDWKTIIDANEKEVGKFIKHLTGKKDLKAEQERMISNSDKKEYEDKKEFFVRYPELLEYCKQKNVQWDYELETWKLIPQKYASSYMILENYLLYIELEREFSVKSEWSVAPYDRDGSCVRVKNDDINITIDLSYREYDKYQLVIFNTDYEKTKYRYKEISNEFKLVWNKEYEVYESQKITKVRIVSLLKKIINYVEK